MATKVRGGFDFETYGWNVKEGEAYEEVKPLCCFLAWGTKDKEGRYQEAFIHDPTHKAPEAVAAIALEKMWELSQPGEPCVDEWWAHNMGRFDGLFLVMVAQRLGWKVEATLADSRVIALEFHKAHGRALKVFDTKNLSEVHDRQREEFGGTECRVLRILDTFNVVPSSLKDCAKDFELPSRKLFEASDYKGDMRDLPLEKLREGCRADAYIVMELLERLEALITGWGGELKRTFSSSALSIIRNDLSERGLKLPDFTKQDRRFVNETANYARDGGRVEVFHHCPDYTLEEYDVNSSYPWAMSQELPWEFIGKVGAQKALRAYDANNPGIYYAKVRVPKMEIPPLPFKLKGSDKHVFFPYGTWERWFVGEELRYAESLGTHVELYGALLFTRSNPFNEFINRVYDLKRTSTGAVRTFTKYLLNGSYGKWGESPEHERLLIHSSKAEGMEYILSHPGKVKDAFENPQYVSICTFNWAKHAHYAIAATITARARILLHQSILKAIGPVYSDSDSVHCKQFIGEVSDSLGALKLCLKDYRGTFYAPKVYRLEELNGTVHLAAKGFPVNDESFKAMLISAIDREAPRDVRPLVRVERMRLLKSQLRDKGTAVARMAIQKGWNGLSQKRRPLKDGSTVPWHVAELLARKHERAYCPLLRKGVPK